MSEKYIDLFDTLKKDWDKFKSNPNNKKIRIRDAANILSTNEACLLSTKINDGVAYLSISNINTFLEELYAANKLMFLVRNNFVVHESNVLSNDLTFLSDIICDKTDQGNCFMEFDANKIVHAFYENKIHRDRSLESFQFFDIFGESIFKVYLKDHNSKVFSQIVDKYKVEYEYQLQKDNHINKKSTKEKSIKINMPFNINGKEIKEHSIHKNIIHFLLDEISENKIQVQIHINGNGVVQYYRGFVSNIVQFGNWINVLDKHFNLHAIEDNLSNNIIFEYKRGNTSNYSIEFFDKKNIHLMGITPLFKSKEDFVKIINVLGVVNE